jgi:hypothetical protein
MKVEKTYFFGWTNAKWVIKELVKMYSHKESFFSYKRFQTGVAFFIFTQGAMYTLTEYVASVSDFIIWATPVLFIAGYTLTKTENGKKNEPV